MANEQQFVFAVGQQSFEGNGNRFCTLVPICQIDGTLVSRREDFPDRGLCWWLVRGGPELERAEPGQLVIGPIEPSQLDPTATDKDRFQVRWMDVRAAGDSSTLIELLDAGPGDDPRRLLDPRRSIELDHVPSSLVLVRLGELTYGPFRAQAEHGDGGTRPWRVRLRNTAKSEVMELDDTDLAAVGGLVVPNLVRVSIGPYPVTWPDVATREIAYRFLPWSRFEAIKARGPRIRRVEPEVELLRRVAKEHLRPRDKVRQFGTLLGEFQELLEASVIPDAAAALEVVRNKREALSEAAGVAAELAEALIQSGVLEDQIERGIEARYQTHLERRAAEIEATVAASTAEAERHLRDKWAELDNLKTLIADERAEKQREFDVQFEAQLAQATAELTTITRQVEEQRLSLKREQEQFSQILEAASARFLEGRDQVLADALALQPALKGMGLILDPAPPTDTAFLPQASALIVAPSWPAWRDTRWPARGRLSEAAFLTRFADYVRAAGYRFKDADLLAFHLLAKCGDLTILGGPSGTGKSSLVRLYAAALAGDDTQARARLLVVDVSPSWTDPADLLGAANLLDRRFEPAPSGLFWHLAAAMQQHDECKTAAGVVSVCFDEMNLAQPEHYLAGLLQALERPERSVAVFAPALVRDDDPARLFARLSLPPTLRVFGTVNFDETTRPLSLRLRDRAAILELAIDRHAGLSPRNGTEDAAAVGPPVTLADLLSWTPDGPLPSDAAALLDRLQPHLLELGAPITARRATAIRRLLAAAGDIMDDNAALDLALATRVLPLLRNTHRRGSREAAHRLGTLLAEYVGGQPRATATLSRLIDAEQDEWNGLTVEP